ncbi:HAD family hydrolase [Salegentibacter mishustinae]|uniref:HAD family hydrolase n=1 Tax=Salegentibacter mishustinae TaxID=270918 RepID=UPI002492FF5A|nr:HAD-IA family hydrolase [Salegentibacter mishustinae]
MIDLNNYNNILWDFDGVLMDSMPVRNKGFELVLKDFPQQEVKKLMDFHLRNGGLSRYVKFRYFFETIRNESVSDSEIDEWAGKFSEIMKKELCDINLLIEDSIAFVKENWRNYNMHIVSGSDQSELRFLCKGLNIASFFSSINGSPTPKKELVAFILDDYKFKEEETVLIGDSINDFEAAEHNSIHFLGYNNPSLKELKSGYIEKFGNE